METVTYLLGAGASAESLPVVDRMGSAIIDSAKIFNDEFEQYANKDDDSVKVKNKINADLLWLSGICFNHSSVDTYAKKLYLDDNEAEYVRLKNALTIYFTIAQKIPNYRADKRYDNFWASILVKDKPLPSNMRIVSWNYDTQLELTYSTFFKVSLSEAYQKLNMASFHDDLRGFQADKFAIFKLNGSAKGVRVIGYKPFYLTDELLTATYPKFFADIIHKYKILQPDHMKTKQESNKSQISFAWEHNALTDGYYSKLKESVKETTILVVIGYSFPFFNRTIDKLLINEYMPNVKKVYFQAPDAEVLKERFIAITDRIPENGLMLRFDKKQFTFPNELDI